MKKTLVLIIHVLAVLLFTAAFSKLYLESNPEAGITWINVPAYEDSVQFAQAVNGDIGNIKRLGFLTDVFGEFDYLYDEENNEHVLASGEIDGVTIDFTLPSILKIADDCGYSFNRETGVYSFDEAKKIEETSVRITKKAYDPDFLLLTPPGPSQGTMTLSSLCKEVLQYLNEYYSLHAAYPAGVSNFQFELYYPSAGEDYVVVSNTDLPGDSLRKLGKYVRVEGNGSTDSNISPAPGNAAYTPPTNRNADNDDYYQLTVGVDTAFPYNDSYRQAAQAYENEVAMAYTWITAMVIATVLFVITLVLILKDASDHADDPKQRHMADRLPLEAFVLLSAILSIIFYYCFKYTLCRAVEALAPFHTEQYWRTVMKCLIVYGLIVVILRSAIRRYRKGVLYQNTLFNRMELAIEDYLERIGLASALFVKFFAFCAANILMIAGSVWLYFTKEEDSRRILMSGALLCSVIVLDALVYNSLFKKARQREAISGSLKEMSTGKSEIVIREAGFSGDELNNVRNINNIAAGLSSAVKEQVKSERMKADLITNVSHDIKTPLTSIINYVGLLKRENIQNEKAAEYIEVLDKKSARLKNLIEDLVEASKASSGNVRIELTKIDIVELTVQAAAEFEEKFARRSLEFCFTPPEESIFVKADGRHLWRVYENLLNNASKYAMEGTRIYGDVYGAGDPNGPQREAGMCAFTIKNISQNKLNISPEELTERFVRGDVSRTTEGSGLGLSIAKSLTKLMGGELRIEIDGDLYKASVILPAYDEAGEPEAAVEEASKAEADKAEETDKDKTE